MSHHTRTFEQELARDEAVAFLHRTADQLASGVLELAGETLPLDGLQDFKVSVKGCGPSLRVKLRAEPARSGPAEARQGDPQGYRSFKKQLKAPWRRLHQQLAAGVLPPLDEVARFVALAEQMTAYPGQGPEYFPALREQLGGLLQAAGDDDREGFARALAALDRLRGEAHDRHR